MAFKQHDVEWSSEKASRFWNYISSNKSLSNKYFGLQAGEHFTNLLNKIIKLNNAAHILDMSCGKGDILSHILNYTSNLHEVYGTDISQKNIDHVNTRFKNTSIFKQAVKLDSYPLNFSDQFFNLIILTEVIEHLNENELKETLNEAYRLTSENGYIVITTPNNEDMDASKVICPDCGCIFHRWQHLSSWTEDSLENLMISLKYKTVFCKPISWGSSKMERLALYLAQNLKLISPNGLIYIGKKEVF